MHWFRMRVNARWESSGLCVQTVEATEQNYPTHDLELATVVFALKYCDTTYTGKSVEFTPTIRVSSTC